MVATIGPGGLVGYVVRARYGSPAFVSPIDLLALVVLALALLCSRWAQSRTLEAAKHVSRIFDPTSDQTANESAAHPNLP